MTLYGLDISNFNGMPAQYRDTAEYQQAEFIIAQAIPRPAPTGYTGPQLRAAHEDGKYCGIYTWLWHDPSWRMGDQSVEDDQRIRLATVPDDVDLDMRPWLDVEDNQSTGWQVPIAQRVDDVNRAFDVLDAWAINHGLPLTGIYWSRYFIDLLFGGVNYWPDRKQWLAHYGIVPGSLIGGNVVAHQYTSTPVDQNVMLESEIVNGEVPMPDCDGVINGLAYVADDLGDKLLAEAKRPSGIRKTVVRDIVKEMERVRTQEVGPRP